MFATNQRGVPCDVLGNIFGHVPNSFGILMPLVEDVVDDNFLDYGSWWKNARLRGCYVVGAVDDAGDAEPFQELPAHLVTSGQ
ncbi:MAG: hypothetical protein GY701_07990 [Sulfitobacter sp.]|nr:hypothetical protein [Sulfitobacter sp.]